MTFKHIYLDFNLSTDELISKTLFTDKTLKNKL